MSKLHVHNIDFFKKWNLLETSFYITRLWIKPYELNPPTLPAHTSIFPPESRGKPSDLFPCSLLEFVLHVTLRVFMCVMYCSHYTLYFWNYNFVLFYFLPFKLRSHFSWVSWVCSPKLYPLQHLHFVEYYSKNFMFGDSEMMWEKWLVNCSNECRVE